ncbi:glycosyltransferase family 4 protein [Fulvimarina sp. 2208YS6-2-32]|uniref:Glycosyltransferase family 4 protein n=1 Tax=Fulvimarina uroteuthidis TaxID=3098149 RepID=A0ABU5I234_9HYPH|nr:glycosyltransferase family 4 protein [Fulvimarina sp. 2208YS6-2-32]MDY8109385.1 glycosyltransferase family 4 protein [Fulvimarina sp. 2208YS6-2-32]
MTLTVLFAIPGNLNARTGGYGYDRAVIGALSALGWTVGHLALPGGFPEPSHADLAETAGLLEGIEAGSLVLVDGLAFSASPEIFEPHAGRLRLVALIHHPLAYETGLSDKRAAELMAFERRALRLARAVIVTSPETGRALVASFDVDRARITVALPGTERQARAAAAGDPPMILSIGSLIPRKGHDVLIEALGGITDLDWRCRIVGDPGRDGTCARLLDRMIVDRGLGGRVVLTGALDEIGSEYANADLFALATLYEGYGMVFAEALAHGLPIVGTRAGPVADLVPEDAGLLVAPGDAKALEGALRTMLADCGLRKTKADGAWRAGRSLPTWETSARRIAETLSKVAS